MTASAVTAIAIALLAFLGSPLFVVIAGSSLLAFHGAGIDLSAVIIEMSRLADSPLLISLPLFIFAGVLLSESKAPERLLYLSRVMLGWLPGGLAIVALLLCAVFTAFTGASGVTIFALGGLLYPIMRKDGYKESFTLGLLTSSGSLGLLFPPSLPLILYGVISGARIDHLFIAGVVPGVIMLAALSCYCVLRKHREKEDKISLSAVSQPDELAAMSLRQAIWELPLPVIVLAGIYSGLLVVGEAAAVTALYVLIAQVGIYRDIPVRNLPALVIRAMVLFGGIIVVLASAMALTNYLVDQEVPTRLFEWTQKFITSKEAFLLVLNIFLLAVGCVLDIYSAVVLVVPLIVPVATAFHVDPIHLGIIFLTNLQIGYSTPPVGLNLFIASYRFERPIIMLYRASLPFLGILLIILALITYLPWLSLFLVSFFTH